MDHAPTGVITDDWCARHFTPFEPELGVTLHETLARMRADHPITWSEELGGFWVVTRYHDVLRIAQDWQTFSSAHGVTVPSFPMDKPMAIPETLDPPEHRDYKRLINAYFTPAKVAAHEEVTRRTVTRMIDDFIGTGRCDFMAEFAQPFPATVFFESVIHAPAEDMDEMNAVASIASSMSAESGPARERMTEWISDFLESRRHQPPRDDIIDAIIAAEIDGAPIDPDYAIAVVQLLLFGGLDTTAGALGHIMTRFCREPEVPAYLRAHPERFNDAVEELLRLDSSFSFIVRTVMRDVEVSGVPMKAGDKVVISWTSANRDEAEFACPAQFDLDRESNRHITFGAGPHRCAGSNLARSNVRIALTEILERMHDLRFQPGGEDVHYHSHFVRAPAALMIEFTPGPARGA